MILRTKMKTLSFIFLILCISILYSNAFCLIGSPKSATSLLKQRRNHFITKTSLPDDLHKTTSLPKETSIWSRFTFSWLKDIMHKGHTRVLDLKDVNKLKDSQQTRQLSKTFQQLYAAEKEKIQKGKVTVRQQNQKRSILAEFWGSPVTKALFIMFKGDFVKGAVVRLLNTLVQFLPSVLVSKILRNLQQEPFVFNSFLTFVQQLGTNKSFRLSILLFLSLSAKTIIENQYFDMMTQLGAQIRGTLSAAIYQKALHLGPSSRQNTTLGEMINYMQLDTTRLEYVATSIHTVWDGILQIVGYSSLLLFYLGPSVLAGIAAMFLIIPLNSFILSKLSKVRDKNVKYTDVRVRLTNEIFQGIRAIKSYNWEFPFLNSLQGAREKELSFLKEGSNYRSVLIAISGASPSFVAFFTLTTYALLGNNLDPTNVFTSLALFNQLRFPLTFFPMLLSSLVEGKVSLQRLQKFFDQDEIQNYVEKPVEKEILKSPLLQSALKSGPSILVSNGTFSWSSATNSSVVSALPEYLATRGSSENADASTSSSHFCGNPNGILTNISLAIKPGELVAVIGPTGTGKSTLLHGLLGELNKINGNVEINGEIAYVPQSSWIPNDSIRNTILFGKEMNWRNYRKAIRVSGLYKDLELFPNGDLTEIGDKGINLSGGQRQRISIARAVYQNADIYLLDDPLSALDSQVGHKVFDNCIKTALKGKTRILVTHKLSILSEVDRVILMDSSPIPTEHGNIYRIIDQGTVWQLILRGHDLTQYVKENPSTTNEMKEAEEEKEKLKKEQKEEDLNGKLPISGQSDSSNSVGVGGENLEFETIDGNICRLPPPPASPSIETSSPSASTLPSTPEGTVAIMDTELAASAASSASSASASSSTTRESDPTSSIVEEEVDIDEPLTIEKKIPSKFLEERREKPVSFAIYKRYILEAKKPFLLLMILCSYLLANSSQVIQQWIVAAWANDVGYQKRSLFMYLFGIAMMAIAAGGFTYLRSYLSATLGVAAGKAIHYQMISRMFRAPLTYFETTPIGRLLLRFSKDLDQIDNQLPNSMGTILASTLQIITSVVAICVVTPSFAVYMLAIFSLYYSVTNYYRPIARELKRLESTSRSPIYSHFSETLNGLTTIRSFHRDESYQMINQAKLDDHLSVYLLLKTLDRWLSFRLEMLGNVIVLFSSLLAVFTASKAGSVGLSLNNALAVIGSLNWAVRNAAETENLMNSVEKVYKLIDETPQERSTELNQFQTVNDFVFPKDSSLSMIESTTATDYGKETGTVSAEEGDLSASLKRLDEEGEGEDDDLSYGAKEIIDDSSSLAENQQQKDDHPFLDSIDQLLAEKDEEPSIEEELAQRPIHSDDDLLALGWPRKGEIIFSNVTMKYREDYDPVLRKVNLIIKPGEKIGIVGRTGSGKSTLFRALLRLNQLEFGSIYIDRINTDKIGLDTLRSKISIIPQDPILFSGSIRMNIDPYHTHTDDELWTALYKSKLYYLVKSLPGELDYVIQENGNNFSIGQKQLLCLTRALIRKSKILLLDEATSSVDYYTDSMIQETIKREFHDQTNDESSEETLPSSSPSPPSDDPTTTTATETKEKKSSRGSNKTTILTIAHRLSTVMNSDKILVMDGGYVKEFDTPMNLLLNRKSIFYQLMLAERNQNGNLLPSLPIISSTSSSSSSSLSASSLQRQLIQTKKQQPLIESSGSASL